MATIETIKAQIWKLERLNVAISGDGKNLPGWEWAKEAPGNWTFSEWKQKRFLKVYPALEAALPDGKRENTSLRSLRGD